MTDEHRSALSKSDGLGWMLLIFAMAAMFAVGILWGVCLANANNNKILHNQAVTKASDETERTYAKPPHRN